MKGTKYVATYSTAPIRYQMISNISSGVLPEVGRTEVLKQDLDEMCFKLKFTTLEIKQ